MVLAQAAVGRRWSRAAHGHLVFVSSLSGKAASAGQLGLLGDEVRAARLRARAARGPARHGRRRLDVSSRASSATPGMFHESGAKLPALRRRRRRPRTSPRAVVRGDRAQPRRDRRRAAAGCAPAPRSPALAARGSSARVQRRLGATEIADADRPRASATSASARPASGALVVGRASAGRAGVRRRCAARGAVRSAGACRARSAGGHALVGVALARDRGDRGEHLVGEPRAVARPTPASPGCARRPRRSRSPRARCAARRGPACATPSSSSAWTSLGLDVGAQAGAQVDRGGLAQRHDRRAEHDVVGDHDRVLALGEASCRAGRASRRALDLAGQRRRACRRTRSPTRNGPRGDQHHAGDQVAERLLGGETEDDRGDGAADGQRARVQARDPQRGERRDDEERQPDQEADRARRRRGPCAGTAPARPQRPRSRASAQPRTTSTTAAATRTGVSTPKICSRMR